MQSPCAISVDSVRYARGSGPTYTLSWLRLDKSDPITGGNKWFKLKHNLKAYHAGSFDGILSFGGPYSNNLAALAECCRREGVPCIGIVRETEAGTNTITLQRAAQSGMRIEVVSRSEYRSLRNMDHQPSLIERFGNMFLIPEGGSNPEGVLGCSSISKYIPSDFTHVALAVGTGCTLCGIDRSLPSEQRLLGVKVLEARQEFQPLCVGLSERVSWESGFTFGGYARTDQALLDLVSDWNVRFPQIPVEPVYTGKLLFGVLSLMERGELGGDGQVLLCHTGGMQAYVR
ncbi:MAG: 1-aminocyclopropane-1-carboxylate deaminase/D-cysteine desulfhydrase [Bacteroidota bacterium]